jgi:hypothetical protein
MRVVHGGWAADLATTTRILAYPGPRGILQLYKYEVSHKLTEPETRLVLLIAIAEPPGGETSVREERLCPYARTELLSPGSPASIMNSTTRGSDSISQ